MQAPFDIAADLDTPVSAYLKLGALKPRFLLESVEGGERLARYSFLGFGEALEVRMDSEALTIDGAYLAFEENIKGSIEVGKLADFVSISEDPYELERTALKDLQVEMTIIGGEVVYENR